MDVDSIRSRFIQENLRRALQEQDRERATRALSAFRSYFEWFEHRMPHLEKLAIVAQFAKLEEAHSEGRSHQRSPNTSSAATVL